MEMQIDHADRRRRPSRARRPWRATRLRYSRISRSRCSRSSSANSRKMRLPSDSSKRSPYFLKNWCEPRSQRMPMSSAWRSSTPFFSSSVPAANRPLAAPLKKRNVGCDSSVGIGGHAAPGSAPRACRGAPFPRRRAARTPCVPRASRRQPRRPRVELAAAALGRDRDAQRVAREDRLGRRRPRGSAGWPVLAALARAVDLQHALAAARSCAPSATSSSSASMSELRNSND